MGVLDRLKPQDKPPKAAAMPDRRAGAAPQTGDVIMDKVTAATGMPLNLLRRYDNSGVWQRPRRVGRPEGSDRGRAAAILRHYTGDGEEILVWMLLLARGEIGAPRRYVYSDGTSEIRFDGPPPTLELMADANRWCADRIFGKAPETVMSITKNLDAQEIDLDKLSTDQLRALGEILRAPVDPPRLVEVAPVDLEP